jgi:nitrate/nitrite-specific signal transduction histidine kinase
MSVGLVLTVLIFLGVLVMAYFANSTVAQPLRGTSKALSEITIRRDFTSRLKQYSDDEIGDIAVAANNLLQEFQQLALTLDGTAQEVGRATTTLTDVAENARVSMTARNAKLRAATQDFMKDIEAASGDAKHEIDVQLHRAQMKFIQTHLIEIDEGTVANERNVTALQGSITKLSDLSKNMHAQIRLLNF